LGCNILFNTVRGKYCCNWRWRVWYYGDTVKLVSIP